MMPNCSPASSSVSQTGSASSQSSEELEAVLARVAGPCDPARGAGDAWPWAIA